MPLMQSPGQALSKLLPILTIFKFKSPILVQAFLLTFNPASSRSLPQNCWQGSGLGLEMVRRIVENRHRSSIVYQTQEKLALLFAPLSST